MTTVIAKPYKFRLNSLLTSKQHASRVLKKKSWVDKLRPELEPKIVQSKENGPRMLVPTPLLISEVIKTVPAGSIISQKEIRDRLSEQYNVDETCRLTTGMFLNIIAGAVEEQLASAQPILAPYWRVVGDNNQLSDKFPPGPARQAELLEAEGVRVKKYRGKWRVAHS